MRTRIESLLSSFKGRGGQNTVEYMLMLTVVVGVVLIAGASIKKFIPQLFAQVQNMIMGAATQMGSAG